MPNEILFNILSYIPEQINVGQTCKKLYEISCKITKCQLNIELPDFAETFDQATFYNSKRRVTSLKIHCKTYHSLEEIYDLLTWVLNRYGDGIEVLELKNVSFNLKTVCIFNYLPNINKLTMNNVSSKENLIFFRMMLPKLKTIFMKSCSYVIMLVVNSLPDDVLHEIHLAQNSATINGDHFRNQRNVKIVSTTDFNTDALLFRNMKLKSLTLSRVNFIEDVLTGQDELTFLKLCKSPTQNEINIIARELVALQVLVIAELQNHLDLLVLQNLKNLRELKFDDRNSVADLRLVIHNTVQVLHADASIDFFSSNSNFIQEVLSKNCPNLHTIFFTSNMPTTLINKILLGYPNLKRLTVKPDNPYEAEIDTLHDLQHFDHLHLKELNIGNIKNTYKQLGKIVSCTALEMVKIDKNLVPGSLKVFLRNQPSVKFLHIKVVKVSEEFIVNLKSNFKEIVELKLQSGIRNYEYFANLKQELKEKFPNSKLMKIDTKNLLLILK